MRISIAVTALLLLPLSIRAQDRTLPPDPSVTPLTPVTGKGVQIYHCQQPQGAGAPAWVFVAPEATLYAGAEAVGTHSAGPTWRWKDGSAITGKLLITQPAPDRASIPWLLLAASPAIDSAPNVSAAVTRALLGAYKPMAKKSAAVQKTRIAIKTHETGPLAI